jgi:hypothetical protein
MSPGNVSAVIFKFKQPHKKSSLTAALVSLMLNEIKQL